MYSYEPEESIYNIIPPKQVRPEKPPMYKSVHKGTIPPTASTFGLGHSVAANISGEAAEQVKPHSHGTMGKAPGIVRPDPQGWLKKNERSNAVQSLQEVKKDAPHMLQPSTLKTKNKPSIPKKEDQPVLNLVSSKNFIVANAVETILAAPKKAQQGAKDYLHKEDYGKVPKYLQHIKQDIDAEYEYIRQLQAQEDQNQNQTRALTDEEKWGMIQGLKAKWEQVNTDYQATTHLTKLDTIGKVKRKEKYEAELSQIEKDIEKLNKKTIFVDAYA